MTLPGLVAPRITTHKDIHFFTTEIECHFFYEGVGIGKILSFPKRNIEAVYDYQWGPLWPKNEYSVTIHHHLLPQGVRIAFQKTVQYEGFDKQHKLRVGNVLWGIPDRFIKEIHDRKGKEATYLF